MPQEFQIVRCYSCQTFQGQQVKKAKKWSCKVCGEKQSYSKIYGQGNGKECRIHVQKLNAMAADMQRGLDEEVEEEGQVEHRYEEEEEEKGGGGPSSIGFGSGGTVSLSPNRHKTDETVSRWQRYLDESSPDVDTNGRSPRQENHGTFHNKRHGTPTTSMNGDGYEQHRTPAINRRDDGEQCNAQWTRWQNEDKQQNASETRCQEDDKLRNAFQTKCRDYDGQRNALQTRIQDNSEHQNAQLKRREDDGELFSSSSRSKKYREANYDKTPSSSSLVPRPETRALATSVAESQGPKPPNLSRWSKYLETDVDIGKQDSIKENPPKKLRLSGGGSNESGKEFSKDSPSRIDCSDLGTLTNKAKGVSSSTNLFPEMSESEWTDLFEEF